MSGVSEGDALATVYRYHHDTKHRYEGYARGPEMLDWEDQPSAFRVFDGASVTELPLLPDLDAGPKYHELFVPTEAVGAEPDMAQLAAMLELAFGLSAWKSMGPDRWALRCNPSSGNLHPTEVYVVICGLESLLPSGVYHYDSYGHQLALRAKLDGPEWCGVMVAGTSVHWREAWKYGERAFRYCQHDMGHALAALRFAAGVVGQQVVMLQNWADRDMDSLLGLDRLHDFEVDEREFPGFLATIPGWSAGNASPTPAQFQAILAAASWSGKARRLGKKHFYQWPVIDEVSTATSRTVVAASADALPAVVDAGGNRPTAELAREHLAAARLIKQRRSAQRFDGESAISRETFFRMMRKTLPDNSCPPFDLWCWPAAVHLLVFVHRVDGLQPGLYFLPRNELAVERFRQQSTPQFGWQPVEDSPGLFQLVAANAQKAAKKLCCYQGIAGNGAFSLGMFSEFDAALAAGSWHYRRLFWECGIIGQILYLEAEAAGVRGTGIGCFFDDEVHQMIGMSGTVFQSLYHFTVGTPLEDSRLQTMPAYAHLVR